VKTCAVDRDARNKRVQQNRSKRSRWNADEISA